MMTDNEIIKALGCCINGHCDDNCPFVETRESCHNLDSLILDLIKRQKAEIERLKDLNNQLESDIINVNMNLEHITQDFRLLKQEKSVVIAEANKELLSKARELSYTPSDWSRFEHPLMVELDDLETICEEMVGEG